MYLGSKISQTGGTDEDIKARLEKARQEFVMLRPVWESEREVCASLWVRNLESDQHQHDKDANLRQWLPSTDPPFEMVRQSAERRAMDIHKSTTNECPSQTAKMAMDRSHPTERAWKYYQTGA